jgi:pyruvate dehydrogenase E2 component (dihydrolipoyllysine-residue acetyltransferase)
MATDVIMPALGMAQEKGTLVTWLKKAGDAVKKGEPLMEVETDKATVEVEAPASGVLQNVTAKEGDEVPVGKTIAVIAAAGEASAKESKAPHPSPLPKGEGIKWQAKDKSKEAAASAAAAPHPLPRGDGRGEGAREPLESGRIAASPAARRIAKENNVDLSSLKGTGPDGSIVAADVARPGGAPQERPAGGPARVKETLPLSGMRRIVAKRMTESKQTAPHFYLGVDVDMSAVEKRRGELKRNGGAVVPSINDFILAAVAKALRDFPALNASFTDEGVKIFADINIGMAVALDEGLVVPVIRNADTLSLEQIAEQSRALAEKAQKKKLFPLDYEGGTFTVSNLGMLGVESFTAIINPPECAILAVGRVAPRVVAVDGGIAARPMMTMNLSADHRVVDGAYGARFLQQVNRSLEQLLL